MLEKKQQQENSKRKTLNRDRRNREMRKVNRVKHDSGECVRGSE